MSNIFNPEIFPTNSSTLRIELVKNKDSHTSYCHCSSTYYEKIKKGLIPPLVKIGKNSSAAILSEQNLVIAARAAGKSDDDIRELVIKIVEARTVLFDELLSQLPEVEAA